jgi:ADP-ribose pyrophosphatase YjhB (NUDIX family)
VKRAVGPRLGRWTLPGGYVEVGELMPEALSREFIEEANVEIDRPHLLALYEMPQLNQLFAVHVADLKSGVVAPGHESIAAQFFAVDDLPIDDLAFPTDACVLRDFAKHGRNADQGVKIGYFYWKRDGRIRMRAHV